MFRPRSILSLILTGFILALLPLAVALGVALVYVDRLADQSRMVVVQAVEATHGGRLLINQLTDMERNVRQYLVLGNNDLLSFYRDTHGNFQNTLTTLKQLALEPDQMATLEHLQQQELALFKVLRFRGTDTDTAQSQIEAFVQIVDLAKDFLSQSAEWVDREIAGLQTLAQKATVQLGWLMAAVIPAVILLGGGFATLIAVPLRRMARAIRCLGDQDFTTPILVGGPRDLKELGEQLDWLRRRLAELSEQQTRFLAHVSHELKTPLTTLREGTELLAEQVIGPLNKEQQEVAGIMQGSSLYLQRLIEDLLNFNQALSRNLEIQREPVEMKALVDAVIATQKLAWKSKDLKIVTALEPVLLMADRDKLSTVVDNLLSNAIKFSPPNGEVSISLQAVNNTVILEFQDSGPGFTAQDAGRVFEAFYQGRVTADGPVKGSGLGLAIAREYALIHRGSLEIVPRAGPGGCMRLIVPITQETSS